MSTSPARRKSSDFSIENPEVSECHFQDREISSKEMPQGVFGKDAGYRLTINHDDVPASVAPLIYA